MPRGAKQLERLGESDAAPGYLLLSLLSLNGWDIGITAGFAGGVLVIATHPLYGRVQRQGESVAEIAPGLVDECSTLSHEGPLL